MDDTSWADLEFGFWGVTHPRDETDRMNVLAESMGSADTFV